MSTFACPVVKLDKIGKHPNADTLDITTVEGCPVIFRSGDFKEGDLAIYIPVDAVVPETVPGTEWLGVGKHRRVKAKKLRGIFSMGLLLPLDKTIPEVSNGFWPGNDVAPHLGITKYEEPEPLYMQTEAAPHPRTPSYPPVYDMESFRKYHNLFQMGEEVVVTEKIHGTNARFVYWEDAMHCGSHKGWKRMDERSLWWKVAMDNDLVEKLRHDPGMIVYGEIYGQVQDLKYGAKINELFFRAFDVYHSGVGGLPAGWFDYLPFTVWCDHMEIPRVPVLYQGPYTGFEALAPLAEGKSTLADHIREGFVIKPVEETWNGETGRTIAKLVSESYLLRKGGTEHH